MTLARIQQAYAARKRKFVKTIVEGDLTAAVNGTAQTIDIGTLPAGAVVDGVAFKLTTQFTGGGATTCTCGVGFSGQATGFLSAADIFGGTTGSWSKGTQGSLTLTPMTAATVVQATITPDAGHTLLALTAGSISIEVYWHIPDAGN